MTPELDLLGSRRCIELEYSLGALAIVIENLDSKEASLLGDSISSRANSSGDMGTVTLAVVVAAAGKVLQELGASIKVLLSC